MALKMYQKDNQVYQVQERSELEAQLLADDFELVAKKSKGKASADDGGG